MDTSENGHVEMSSFVREDRRALFEEHQRMGRHHDLNAHITDMIRDLYTKGTFADRMAAQSLLALMNSGKPRG